MNKVITISREYGAGGHSIGQRVAKELGIPFYDKDIMRATVKQSGFDLDLVEREQEDESRMEQFLKSMASYSGGSGNYHDTQRAIRELQQAIILKYAKEGPCVILGRCADVTLRKAGIDCLNVFVYADDVHRAVRVGEMIGSTNATEIQRLIAKKDSSRHNYYQHFTGKRWGDSHNYDLCLDSGILGYDLCVELIKKVANEAE